MNKKARTVFAQPLGRSTNGVTIFLSVTPAILREMAATRKALDMPYHFDAATGRWTWPDGDEPVPPQRASTLAEAEARRTQEQVAREYKLLKQIEERRAEARMLAGKKAVPVDYDPPQNSAEGGEKGDARKIAAEKLGVSHHTAERLVAVVDAIDAAEADGDKLAAVVDFEPPRPCDKQGEYVTIRVIK